MSFNLMTLNMLREKLKLKYYYQKRKESIFFNKLKKIGHSF